MQFYIIAVGKIKSPHYIALNDLYLNRVSHFTRFKLIAVKEVTESTNIARAQEQEAKLLIAAVPPNSYVILLDVVGEMVDSATLAKKICHHQNLGTKNLCFIIGGYSGIAPGLKESANWCWSLSPLTFTHEMAQVLVLEQIYRAYSIINGFPYAK